MPLLGTAETWPHVTSQGRSGTDSERQRARLLVRVCHSLPKMHFSHDPPWAYSFWMLQLLKSLIQLGNKESKGGEVDEKRNTFLCLKRSLCSEHTNANSGIGLALESWQVHLECLQECWNSVSLKCKSVVWWWEIYDGGFVCLMLK